MLYVVTGQGRLRGRQWESFERALTIKDHEIADMARVQGVAPHHAKKIIAMCDIMTSENVTELRNLKVKKL